MKIVYRKGEYSTRILHVHEYGPQRVHIESVDGPAVSEGYSHDSLAEIEQALQDAGFTREDQS